MMPQSYREKTRHTTICCDIEILQTADKQVITNHNSDIFTFKRDFRLLNATVSVCPRHKAITSGGIPASNKQRHNKSSSVNCEYCICKGEI